MNRQGAVLRKFALAASTCVVLLATLAHSQQIDIAVSGSTLMFPSKPSDLASFHGPVENGGTFVGLNADYIGFRKHRLGLNFESAWRRNKADYPYNGETYRPIFSDVNALFAPRVGRILGRSVGLDLMAGIGVSSTRFYLPAATTCSLGPNGCIDYTSSNHFMEDIGGGIRWRVWRHFFVRPEARYYHIQSNFPQFNSNNVFRVGASFGWSFGGYNPAPQPPAPPQTPQPK
jgi:hypothetical protein